MHMDDYYVYFLLDPRYKGNWEFGDLKLEYKPFYVGKGRMKRCYTHTCPFNLKKKSLKNSIIKAILSTDKKPIVDKSFTSLTEEKAFGLEREVISHFGRADKNEGILSNHTDGGDGSSGNMNVVSHPKKIYQYSLDGEFLKSWESMVDAVSELGSSSQNISTAIKRNGTAYGFIWSYTKLESVETKIKYQMPVKYSNIKKICKKTDVVLKTYNTLREITDELGKPNKASNKIISCVKGNSKSAYGYIWKI